MRAGSLSLASRSGLLAHYEHALSRGVPLNLREADGSRHRVDVRRWLQVADAADETVVSQCVGPTLDVGCGPGRLVAALRAQSIDALGIDIAPLAVAMTRRRGGLASRRSVFAPLPREGRWGTIVLLDGNIGIGGNPASLLARVAQLLAPTGQVIVETALDADADRRLRLHVEAEPEHRFDWATVGLSALSVHASTAAMRLTRSWQSAGRTFAVLESCLAQLQLATG